MNYKKGDPEMAREINRALVLDLLRREELLPRAELSRRLNLSKVTVSTIVNELLEENFVIEQGEGNSASKVGGRKPILLSLNTDSHYVIGIDVGTTNITVGVGNFKGELVFIQRIPTISPRSVENITNQIVERYHFAINNTKIPQSRIMGLGLSVAGTVLKEKGFISFSPDFGWKNIYIKEILENKLSIQTLVDNCTRVMALSELWFGKGKDKKNLFFINIGYGIGSALVIDGRIYNNYCEFGHSFVTTKDVPCNCGKKGCIEAVASGHAIEKTANETISQKNGEYITAKKLAEMAAAGDNQANAIFSDAGRYLGRSISIIADVINPDMIILGGGVSLAGKLLLDPILREAGKHIMPDICEQTHIELSSLGMDAGVRGAVALALNELVFKQKLLTG